MTRARVTAFPWERVPRLDRAGLALSREIGCRLEAALDPVRLLRALEQLLGALVRAELDLVFVPANAGVRSAAAVAAFGAGVSIAFRAHGLRLEVTPEAELLRAAVAHLLEQDFELGWADTGVDPPLAGAGAALLLEVARRAAENDAPELLLAPESEAPASSGARLEGAATLWLAGKPYRVEVRVHALPALRAPQLRSTARSERLGAVRFERLGAVRLERLGDVRLAVPWVCAMSSTLVKDVIALRDGDVWVPGASAWLGADGAATSAGLLMPAHSKRGLPVRVLGGRIVLGSSATVVHEELESTMSHEESELEQIVGETPLVVRLEVGALEMSAAEWAALRPGDVVQSGRRLEDPVILRAAGREIARGELVDIEGELGVRITRVGAARISP